MNMMNVLWICLMAIFFLPLLVYLCVKFGTVGYYKAKEFIEHHKQMNE